MFRRELARGVHPPALADRPDGRQVVFLAFVNERPVDLAGRELHETFDADVERRLDHLVGAQQVHLHGRHGVAIDGVHAGDRRAVNDDVAAFHRPPHRVVVHHVALDEVQVRMSLDVRELDGIAMQVVVDDDVVVVQQTLDQIRTDEPGAAGDAHALARQSHWTFSSPSRCDRCPIAPAQATACAESERPDGAGTACVWAHRTG